MKKKLEEFTLAELVDRFAEIGVAQDRALLYNEISKFNALFNQMRAVDGELRTRGPVARQALVRLFNHPNIQVRLQAAKWSLAIAPQAGRQVIEEINKSQWFPQALEAGMTLRNLDDGIFIPD
jgi:hypothetical protein